MKQIIELNGVANIDMLLQIEVDKTDDGKFEMNPETYYSILRELRNLNKYMRAYNDAINSGQQTPFWHEIYEK